MSGEKKLQTYNDRVTEFIRVLDEYSNKLGLYCIQYNKEVEDILCFGVDNYKGLSSEDSFAYACVLENYALYLKREYNRHKNIEKWAEKHLKYVISQHWDDFALDGYNNYDIISNKIIANSEPAHILNKIIDRAGSRVIELDGISMTVGMFAGILKSMAEAKRWKK